MMIEQVVQVEFLGSPRAYTYVWEFDPEDHEGALVIGDQVEVPPNVVRPDGGSGRVVAYGSQYTGPMAKIVRRIDLPPEDDGLWAGWEQDERYA